MGAASPAEELWIRLGAVATQLSLHEQAVVCYEAVLRNNAFNVPALMAGAALHRGVGNYVRAIDLYQQALNVDNNNGHAWAAVAHCYVCVDELHKAYTAYQQALLYLQEPHDPYLWYGIGVLYDRYGSSDHAREAFEAVLSLAPAFERTSDVRFRLAMICKLRHAYADALEHLRAIADAPPAPLTPVDILCHVAHIEELRGNFPAASAAYQRAFELEPNNAKTLQQFAWYCHTRAIDTAAELDVAPATLESAAAAAAAAAAAVAAVAAVSAVADTKLDAKPDAAAAAAAVIVPKIESDADAALLQLPPPPPEQPEKPETAASAIAGGESKNAAALADIAKLHERAEALLKRSIELDASDPYAHYLLGRCCMARKDYRAAYDAYQQAVYRDGRNAAFWCSIGVLYFHIQQHRDALDAFSRAIRVDARVPEVWFNLGTLYESCRQFADAGDAYQRAVELAPDEPRFAARLAEIGRAQRGESTAPPLDVVEPCASTIALEARHAALLSPFGGHMNGNGADRHSQPPQPHQQQMHLQQLQMHQQQHQLQQHQQAFMSDMLTDAVVVPKKVPATRGRPVGSRGGGRGAKRNVAAAAIAAAAAAADDDWAAANNSAFDELDAAAADLAFAEDDYFARAQGRGRGGGVAKRGKKQPE